VPDGRMRPAGRADFAFTNSVEKIAVRNWSFLKVGETLVYRLIRNFRGTKAAPTL
jgi:hypothetical protein